MARFLGRQNPGRPPRPPADAVGSLATPTGTSSFPSGHTAVALALVLAITIVLARTTTQRVAALTAGTLFVALVAFSRLRGTALVLLLGPPLERRMGSLKYAIAAVSTQILGVGIALGFLAAAQGLLGSWKAEMGGHLFMGPSAFIIGTAMAGTASMATLWRRRIRLAVSALLLLLALYSGGFADLVRLGAATAGAVLGHSCRAGGRFGHPVSTGTKAAC
ncbi:uncharacterized protein Cgl0966/cg1103 [Arthrobacter sp. Hiyo8]|nr:uncharacterized protein Cgl0966/cg1103 [Arthrobacter sp. Hiyo8]